jgi:hypothetical protein
MREHDTYRETERDRERQRERDRERDRERERLTNCATEPKRKLVERVDKDF